MYSPALARGPSTATRRRFCIRVFSYHLRIYCYDLFDCGADTRVMHPHPHTRAPLY